MARWLDGKMAIMRMVAELLSFPYHALYVFFLDKLHIIAWSWTTCRQGSFSNGIPGSSWGKPMLK
ncbi:hypothetical protein M6B38_413310 [Iris pallida]|uniref:Uncharacterized protein n=1 Tax=Iris pallida TaxID=29817 RepID=A0AAX6FL51_IRIPA|nr:hypothetical protein M6B38_413310 [Iris pallida]